ncbi:Type-1 restriction enzyme EcoKI specificity protein [Mycobacterium attenuatum]|uniref:restriction endonuclease subunit S n=1 Tax=Mycobacterium attenuatum TaxID=2341086 RepID=UPI000F0365F0|nr:restriction endonuclease subunit S [Mycobacterium attenuatum]VBA48885.1 Type-1 restriction enzyme EcoKI specificity protein [Mycobacterium attenuatum]
MSGEGVDLPNDWKLVTTGDIAEVVGGGTPKTTISGNFTDEGGHPWITPADLTGYTDKYIARGRRNLSDQGLATSSAKYMPAGTVLYSTRAPIGYVAIASNPVTTNQGFRSFAPSPEVDPEYLYYGLKLARPEAERLASGTTFAELSGSNAKKIHLPLAPLDTQRQIVRLLDAANSSNASALQHLTVARRAVEHFRQAVLAAACSGRLTADWREHNEGTVSGDLVSTATSSVMQDREVPSNWVVARVADIGTVQLGGTPSRKRPDYWDGGIPWVSSGEVANCRIASTRETISALGLASSSAKVYSVGTVLIAMIGEGKTRGQAAILDIEAVTNQNAAGILADRQFIDPEYLWRWALAEYETTRAAGTGGNQPALNKQRVANLVIPVPPLNEQVQIVRRVDQLLGLADGLRTRIEAASKRVDRSSQAVLAKAFRGELVAGG